MSKIGKQPIKIPAGVSVEVDGSKIKISGPKGTIEKVVHNDIRAVIDKEQIVLEVKKVSPQSNSLHGTTRAILANAVKGVNEGWTKVMEMVGTGYRAEVSGSELILTVGFSHPVKIQAPNGISFKVEKSDIPVSGADKEIVGLICTRIRSVRPPEPYKGKGIRYKNEVIRRKAGKAAKAAGA